VIDEIILEDVKRINGGLKGEDCLDNLSTGRDSSVIIWVNNFSQESIWKSSERACDPLLSFVKM